MNYIMLLVTVPKSFKYKILICINIWKKNQLVSGLTKCIYLYAKYDFEFNFINGDNKFETLRDYFPRVDFNITAEDEHIP